MFGVNKVILLGYLGNDPEVRYFEVDRARAPLPFATQQPHRSKSGEQLVATTWHRVVCWPPLAFIAEEHLKKGEAVYIEGRLGTRSYQDAQGQHKTIAEVTAQSLVLLGRSPYTKPPHTASTKKKDE